MASRKVTTFGNSYQCEHMQSKAQGVACAPKTLPAVRRKAMDKVGQTPTKRTALSAYEHFRRSWLWRKWPKRRNAQGADLRNGAAAHEKDQRIKPHSARIGDRGRDLGCPRPPARIRTCAANASGSCLESWRRTAAPATGAESWRAVSSWIRAVPFVPR